MIRILVVIISIISFTNCDPSLVYYRAPTHNGFAQVSYNSESSPIVLPYVIDYLGNQFGFGGLVPCTQDDCLIFYGSFQYYNENAVGASIALYDISSDKWSFLSRGLDTGEVDELVIVGTSLYLYGNEMSLINDKEFGLGHIVQCDYQQQTCIRTPKFSQSCFNMLENGTHIFLLCSQDMVSYTIEYADITQSLEWNSLVQFTMDDAESLLPSMIVIGPMITVCGAANLTVISNVCQGRGLYAACLEYNNCWRDSPLSVPAYQHQADSDILFVDTTPNDDLVVSMWNGSNSTVYIWNGTQFDDPIVFPCLLNSLSVANELVFAVCAMQQVYSFNLTSRLYTLLPIDCELTIWKNELLWCIAQVNFTLELVSYNVTLNTTFAAASLDDLISVVPTYTDSLVNTIIGVGSQMLVIGSFQRAGLQRVHGTAVWNGTDWHPFYKIFGLQLSSNQLTTYNNMLYMAIPHQFLLWVVNMSVNTFPVTEFSWNTTSDATPVGVTVVDSSLAFFIYNSFENALYGIVRLDMTTSEWTNILQSSDTLNAIANDGSNIYVAGGFTLSIGGFDYVNILKYNVQQGFVFIAPLGGLSGTITSLLWVNSQQLLYAGGKFSQSIANNLAACSQNGTWTVLIQGPSSPVNNMLFTNDTLYMLTQRGGLYQYYAGTLLPIVSAYAAQIALIDPCNTDVEGDNNTKGYIIGIVVVAVAALVLLLVAYILKRRSDSPENITHQRIRYILLHDRVSQQQHHGEQVEGLLKELEGKKLKQISIDQIKFKGWIAKGGHGTVYKALYMENGASVCYKPDVGIPVAVKAMLNPDMDELLEFLSEIKLHSELNHPNIVDFVGILRTESIYLVLKYMKSTLQSDMDEIVQQKLVYRIDVALQVAEGMRYLHDQDVVHRDLKPGNVLWDGTTAKISDFGTGRRKDKAANTAKLTSWIGTAVYMAPEVQDGFYNRSVDVYSYGCLLCELVYGQHPFAHIEGSKETYTSAVKVEDPIVPQSNKVPEQIRKLILQCLDKQHKQRPTFVDIVKILQAYR